MSAASIVVEGNRPKVRLERHLVDPPSVVWRALTDREQLQAWFPCDVIVTGGQWVVGATITFPFPSNVIDMTLAGEVLVVDEPRVLSFTWGEEILRFELSEANRGTRLVLFDEVSPAAAARNAAGWDACLDRLPGIASPVSGEWQSRFERYSTMFEPILGAQEGPPAGYKGK